MVFPWFSNIFRGLEMEQWLAICKICKTSTAFTSNIIHFALCQRHVWWPGAAIVKKKTKKSSICFGKNLYIKKLLIN